MRRTLHKMVASSTLGGVVGGLASGPDTPFVGAVLVSVLTAIGVWSLISAVAE